MDASKVMAGIALVWCAALTYVVATDDDGPEVMGDGLEARVTAIEDWLNNDLDPYHVVIHDWILEAREKIDWDQGDGDPDPPPPPPPEDPPDFG